MLKADIVIVGGGVVGVSIARELARYNVDTVLVEKGSDVASGTSKANTAILHAGFDPEPGTLKALLGLQGNVLYDVMAAELDVPVRRTGSLVVAFSDEEMETLEMLLQRGQENGVDGLRIVPQDELWSIEPHLNPLASAGLYAKSAGIVNPFEMVLASAEEAALNGVSFLMGTEVTGFAIRNGQVEQVVTTRRRIEADIVVNAAGVWADVVAGMVGSNSFKITPRKGEYMVLDRNAGNLVHTVLFPVPTALSKGITVTPTTDGNILLGPTAEDLRDRFDLSTTQEGLSRVLKEAQKLVPLVSARDTIRVFAGVRAVSNTDDFIVELAREVEGFVNVAGIQSPGVTAAPAIARRVVELIRRRTTLTLKECILRRHRIPAFRDASPEVRLRLFGSDPKYGRVVCRCETVTEAEVLDAIHRVPGAHTVDGVKFRTRAGMGRCQGGFCGPRVLELLSRELGLSYGHVTLRGEDSRVLTGSSKRGVSESNDGQC